MKLHEWIKQQRGRASWLARKMGKDPARVTSWAKRSEVIGCDGWDRLPDRMKIEAEVAIEVSRWTKNAVTKHEMRPDIFRGKKC